MLRTRMIAFLLVSFLLFSGTAEALVTCHPLESPNKDFKMVIYNGPLGSQISFAVFYKGSLVATVSQPVFEVANDDELPATASFTLRHLRDGDDGPVPKPSRFKSDIGGGETKSIRNVEGQADYDEYTFKYRRRKEGRGELRPGTSYNPDDYEGIVNVVFRAYDDGIAYRYEIAAKEEETITLKNELTEFSFPDDYALEDSVASLSKIGGEHPSPLLMKIPDVPALTFGEVSHKGFAVLRFKPGREWGENTFSNLFDFDGKVDRTGKVTAVALNLDGDTVIQGNGIPYRTPWRYMKITSPDSEGMIESLTESSGCVGIVHGSECMR